MLFQEFEIQIVIFPKSSSNWIFKLYFHYLDYFHCHFLCNTSVKSVIYMYINNIAKKKDLFHKPFFFFLREEVLCTYQVIPSFVHVCIYFEWFSLVAIFRTGFYFVEYFSGSFRAFLQSDY